MLPVVAEHLGMEASNKEGWLTGLSGMILEHQKDNHVELGVCFPATGELAEFGGALQVSTASDLKGKDVSGRKEQEGMLYAFGFYEDVKRAEVYEDKTERRLEEIMECFRPDLIHCFGTEYPHTLAAVKAFGRKDRTLIGIQGLCSIYAGHFRADLPDQVWKRITFRDRIKKDDLRRQHEKYVQRGVFEIEALQRTGHVTGRTK